MQLKPDIQPPGSYIFEWHPSHTLSDPTSKTPLAHPSATTTYTLFVVNTGNDCSRSDTVTVIVIEDDRIVIPNAFSSNGDHQNEVFFEAGGVEIVHMQVFNRWGKKVYEGGGLGTERLMDNHLPLILISITRLLSTRWITPTFQ